MGKVSKSFTGKEVLPKELYEKMGDLAMRYLNPKIIIVLQIIRDFYGKEVRVNSGIDGRTIRMPSDSAYNKFSDHSYGNAVDFDIIGKSAQEVYNDVLFNPMLNALLKKAGVTAMEKNRPTWIHLSVADFTYWDHLEETNGIKLLNP